MQGGDFLSGAAGGFFGSLGASGFGAVAGEWANSFGGNVFFGVLSGGIGAELTGGNFWVGAVTGGIVAGLNYAMHSMDNGGKGKGKKQNGNNSGKKTLNDIKNKPPEHPDYKAPKGGARKVKNPNGTGTGWVDKDGHVWVPTDHKGTHAPHWDKQNPKGGHTNVYPTEYIKPIIHTSIEAGIIYGVQKVIDHMLGRVILMTPIIQMQINQDNIYQPTSL